MDDRLDKDNPLAAEIMAEMASAYFSTTRKMQAALAALAEFDQKVKSKRVPDDVNSRRRDSLLAEAAEHVFFFVIQREAMKLPYYEELFSDFDVPDEVRKRMGPKPSWSPGAERATVAWPPAEGAR